ncbi:MAG: T9SS type A sorting domain-containing protein [Bacteroidota bacterium]
MKKLLLLTAMVFMYLFTFSQISITSTQNNVSCFGGSNGAINITINGGTAPYSYTWTTGAVNTNPITGLSAGVYTVVVMDALGGLNSQTITITEPTQLVASAFGWPDCFGNGSGSVNAFGGTPAYTYSWSNGSTASNTFLNVGSHTVTVTDANGCTSDQTVMIAAGPPVFATASSTVGCGLCTGAVTGFVSGGTGPYTYSWQFSTGATFYTTMSVQNVCASIYTLVATDVMGCSSSYVGNITPSAPTLTGVTATLTAYNETCYLSGDGSVDLAISGANPGPFTYQWSNSAITQDLTNLISDIYSVTIYDAALNCLTLSDTVIADGINCGTISGNVYVDNNGDCTKNSGDNNYHSAVVVVNPGNRIGYTNLNGDYSINNVPYGTYSVNLPNTSSAIFPTCTTTLTPTVNSGTPNALNNNLSVGFNSVIQPDLMVSAWNQGVIPGFSGRIWYYLSNLNNVNASGVFKATLPAAFISNISNAAPAGYTFSADTIIWNFNNITYSGGQHVFYIDFITPLTTPLGSIFTSCMWAKPIATDLNPANNLFCYMRTVNGSYDPNDKAVNPAGVGATGDIPFVTTDLTYMIRFQNTGNGPAVNIVVKDTISPNVDIATFEMLSASHGYDVDILPGNVLRWKFNNIMLADSGTNEPASHGFIQYRIKRAPVDQPGTEIKNTAYIYFDFNDPVATNTTLNTIGTVTGVEAINSDKEQWLVYPNPSTGLLNVINNNIAADIKLKIEVLNSFGQLVLEETAVSNHKTLDMSKLSNGVYFVKIVLDKQSTIKRIVLNK